MKGTRIKIKVEFEEHEVTSESVTEPIQKEDGAFVVEMPEAFEADIDECEQALLRASEKGIPVLLSKENTFTVVGELAKVGVEGKS